MTCDPLAYTGSGAQLGPLLILGIVCLLTGAVVILLTRRRGRVVTAALILLIAGSAMMVTIARPSTALAADCPPVNNSLTIVQTSVMVGLAPGIAPVAITGRVINNGADSTFIDAVEVEITGVITDPGATPGACDASDYVLLDTRMRVGRTLGPGGFTEFTGASIGFSNKSTNQDSCKNATLALLYTANPP